MFTIENMLALPIFDGFEILAGRSGLGRRILFVDFLEVPDAPRWPSKDTFIFTTAYAYRDAPELLRTAIETYAYRGTAGLGFKLGRYINGLPDVAYEVADREGMPLVSLPQELPWAVITRAVMREIFRCEREDLRRRNIVGDELFTLDRAPRMALEMLSNIGWKENRVVWAMQWSKAPAAALRLASRPYMVSRGEGVRMIAAALPDERPRQFLEVFRDEIPNAFDGEGLALSGAHRVADLSRAFAETAAAGDIHHQLELHDDVIIFSEVELLDAVRRGRPLEEIKQLAQRLIAPLIVEDSRHQTDLLNTLKVWLACEGSSFEATKRLFIHRNTLRNRLERIASLVPLNGVGLCSLRLAFLLFGTSQIE